MHLRKEPWMADNEIKIMASLFETQRPRRVLEWGAGGATLYWPQRYDFIEEWIAIEHDEEFAEAVLAEADSKVGVLQLDAPQYYEWARRIGQFNMIIVDGRHRVECLEVAREILAERGIVVLHDSGRPAYNEAWGVWPRREELYPGELPVGDGYYKHRGSTVFWQDKGVKQAGWCRDYQAEPLERPEYEPPEVIGKEAEAEMEAEIEAWSEYIDEAVEESEEAADWRAEDEVEAETVAL